MCKEGRDTEEKEMQERRKMCKRSYGEERGERKDKTSIKNIKKKGWEWK